LRPAGGILCDLEFAVTEGAGRLARTRRASTRPTEDLAHCNPTKLAAICGVSCSSVRRWQKESETFPKANKRGDLCIRDAMQWYLVNKAPAEIREDSCRRLADSLDWQIVGQEASKPDKVQQPVSKADADASYREQVNRLELRTKEAAFQLKYGDAIRMKHVKAVLARFARKVRDWADDVQRKTGHPVSNAIGAAVEAAVGELAEHLPGGTDGTAAD